MQALALLQLLAVASAYSLCASRVISVPAVRELRRCPPLMQEMQPDDVPGDVPGDVELPPDEGMLGESVEMEADEGVIAKEALKVEVAQGLTGPRPDKAVVGEILLALEARNPTVSPATSSLLNGKWKMLYASGSSPGLKALQLLLKAANLAPKSPSGADLVDIEDAYITISEEQPRSEAAVRTRVLSFENTVKLSSRLEAESAVRLVETYDAALSELGNLRLPFQSPVQYKRSVLVSYLDDEILVIRDAFGRPDVLMRVEEELA